MEPNQQQNQKAINWQLLSIICWFSIFWYSGTVLIKTIHAVVGNHVRKRVSGFDNPVGMLVKHGEKIAFARQIGRASCRERVLASV